MAKQVFQAEDGSIFKTKKAAENRDKKILAEKKAKDFGLTVDEIQEKMEYAAKNGHLKLKLLLDNFNHWTKFPIHIIKSFELSQIELKHQTLYIKKEKIWRKTEINVLFKETGSNFTSPELHLGTGVNSYIVKNVEKENDFKLIVEYEDKYNDYEKAVLNLKSEKNLSEKEIKILLNESQEVYEEEGENRRWNQAITTVIEIDGKCYAIDWLRGLTESQENEYWNQPYEVKLVKEEVTVVKTTIVKAKKENNTTKPEV